MSKASEPGGDRDTVVLYRHVGQRELDLVEVSGFRAWPPRLAHQPILYPVLFEAYAHEIAKRWNTHDHAPKICTYDAFRSAGESWSPVSGSLSIPSSGSWSSPPSVP